MAMMGFTAASFAGRPEFGAFSDAGRAAGVLFAVALIDASVIGASAVSLSMAYALGDLLSLKHSLHRKPAEAKGFYAVYAGLVGVAALLVLTPGTPLGLLTNAVQTLAGVLLPSATVFLLLLCNDRAVLGPWVNGRWLNLFTGTVVAVLVVLSVILTASVLWPDMGERTIGGIILAGLSAALAISLWAWWRERGRRPHALAELPITPEPMRGTWTMPPLDQLPAMRLTLLARIWQGSSNWRSARRHKRS